MGTSLSGLTPATTFDGLLKTSDNDALDATLKTIGTGDGTDSVLQLSDSALQVNGPTTINGAQMTIIGAGSDALTTSLLVQNSLGADSFKVDDAGSATAAGFKTTALTISSNQILGSSGIKLRNSLQASGGTSVSTADGAPANTMLYVKGFGATSGSTALLVQNSAGTELMKVQDGGNVLVNQYIYPADGTTNSSFRVSNGNGTQMAYAQGIVIVNPNFRYFTSYLNKIAFEVAATTGDVSINGATGAKVGIKGNGATSATTALLVQNSAGTELLKVNDDGSLDIKQGGNSAIYVSSSRDISLRNGQAVIGNQHNSFYQNTCLGFSGAAVTPGARLHIKGSGNDATTTALLVQNSDTTPLDLFKILNDGTLVAPNLPTSATGLPTGAIYNDAGTLKIV